jgi:hypothetical protein
MHKPDLQKRFAAEIATREAVKLARQGLKLIDEGKRAEAKQVYDQAKAKVKLAKALESAARPPRKH